jgi:hypothetical protein
MTNTTLAGLSLIDAAGLTILGVTLATLVIGLAINFWLRGRYAALEQDLRAPESDGAHEFRHPVLRNILRDASAAVRRPGEANLQAVIEERFAADLRGWLLGP